ncbi:MAG TPA: excinuclease ABC subunit UvrB [Oscillospiraceae bacterium]|nr:excinuclease ABC subunit UvrB [Oscillospiraceae bacterium]HPS34577.1 excinuclease ABC subunit UvrB [Oscillospiraceae bacterium]
MKDKFILKSDYKPTGDQPQAIDQLVNGVLAGKREQCLLGVTGSGKTFTMANVIAAVNRPTLVLAHNKILAAQLCSEFREFFPDNAVEFFVSYYDYYQPESYIPSTDTYIEKDLDINTEIEKLRHSATTSLFERRDVIVVSSVSCIYGLGDPQFYGEMVISLRPDMQMKRDELIKHLVANHYERNDIAFERNKFRVRGDVVDIFPAASGETGIRVEFFGDTIERLTEFQAVTGQRISTLTHAAIYPASHYLISPDDLEDSLAKIEAEMIERKKWFTDNGKLIEAQRIEQRTRYDMEMLREVGYVKGSENYSPIFEGRKPGEPPFTLFDYFPKDFLFFADESHMSLPQVRGMYAGDRARKTNLIDFGFRLPSAYDHRPLTFDEFYGKLNQAVYVSATPGPFEREKCPEVVEQIIRPTGLLDPNIEVRPTEGQIDDLIAQIHKTAEKGERTLVLTMTKKMAEDLTAYLTRMDIRVKYLHFEIDTIERMELIRDFRLGEFDVLVGINLMREGLDIPELSLVAILDADKEGFLRAETSLIQIIGRAARNTEGKVIMYADNVTRSMEAAINETYRRRGIQNKFNEDNGITPQTIKKGVRSILEISSTEQAYKQAADKLTERERRKAVDDLTAQMKQAAKLLDFEYAALLRDKIIELQKQGEAEATINKK